MISTEDLQYVEATKHQQYLHHLINHNFITQLLSANKTLNEKSLHLDLLDSSVISRKLLPAMAEIYAFIFSFYSPLSAQASSQP